MEAVKKLENIIEKTIPAAAALVCFSDHQQWNPIGDYTGDFKFTFFYAVFSEGMAGPVIENFGKEKNSRLVETVGKHLGEITTSLATAYIILGETVVDWVPQNTMDFNDTYAAVAGGIVGYALAKKVRKAFSYKLDLAASNSNIYK